MLKKNEDDDGLYDLIDGCEECETCRTDDLIFNTSRIDWNRMKVRVAPESPDKALCATEVIGEEEKPLYESIEFSSRSKLVNDRAEVNLGIYLTDNGRRSIFNAGEKDKYVSCHECGNRNTIGVSWCLFCGLLIRPELRKCGSSKEDVSLGRNSINDIDQLCSKAVVWRNVEIEEVSKVEMKVGYEVGDKKAILLNNKDVEENRRDAGTVKLDLGGLETVRCIGGVDWDIDLDEVYKKELFCSSINPCHTVVPPLDLSILNSHRDNMDIVEDESKENYEGPTRNWASSSTAWVDIPDSILQKKPSSYYRNKLNSCTNKIRPLALRFGVEEESDYMPLLIPAQKIDRVAPPRLDEVASQWQCLPAEMWLNVMVYLSHFQLSCLQRTCRRLYLIGLESFLWRSISLFRHPTLNNDHIFYIAKKKPTELHLKNCCGTNVTLKGLEEMFKICGDKLKKISFISCSKGAFEDDSFLVMSSVYCPNVTHINASYLMNLGDNTLLEMIHGFAKIESLNIMGAHSISNKSIKSLVDKNRSSLINLDLYGCFKLNSMTLTLLEECLNLKSLALGSISNLKRTSLISMLKKLSQLTILDLRGTMNLVDDALLQQICQSCPKLQQIILTNSCRLTDNGVMELAKSCVSSSLKILDICGCSKITEKGLEVVLKHCHELEDLDISCTGIKGDGAKFFKMYTPPKLRCLRINNNKFISSDDLFSLIGSCKKLGTIYMCGSTSIGSWRPLEERFPHVTFKHE